MEQSKFLSPPSPAKERSPRQIDIQDASQRPYHHPRSSDYTIPTLQSFPYSLPSPGPRQPRHFSMRDTYAVNDVPPAVLRNGAIVDGDVDVQSYHAVIDGDIESQSYRTRTGTRYPTLRSPTSPATKNSSPSTSRTSVPQASEDNLLEKKETSPWLENDSQNIPTRYVC